MPRSTKYERDEEDKRNTEDEREINEEYEVYEGEEDDYERDREGGRRQS